jgi:hypothetical protein
MRSGFLALVSALALASAPARANDVIADVLLTSDSNFTTAFFGAVHTDAVDFVDVFTIRLGSGHPFGPTDLFEVSVSLVTTGSGGQNIDFFSARLDDDASLALDIQTFAGGFLETAGTLSIQPQLPLPFTLWVRGGSGAGAGVAASYSGTVNVRLVPEPGTRLLTAIGLVCLAAVTPRRSRPAR